MSDLKGKKLSPKESFSLALKEARKGEGFITPNPPVGAVFLDKEEIFLSSGYHKAYGKPHAEQDALKKIKDKKKLKDGHLYVTLEPCSHFGKTPPCTEDLIKLSLNSITYGMKDSNPLMQGKSLKLLESKGIKIKPSPYFKEEVKELYVKYQYGHKYKKPFVALKVATTLDGIIALNKGSSQWISSKKSRDHVSYLRACYDGVLIGVGTFLEDNPKLNSRIPPFHNKKNKVVILDPAGRSLDLITKSSLAQVRPMSHITVCVDAHLSLKKYPFKVLKASLLKNGVFNLSLLLSSLYEEGSLSSLLVEGGAHTFSSFVEQDEAQKLYQFLSPSLAGSRYGKSFLESFSVENLGQIHFSSPEFFKIGKDFLFKGFFSKKA